jgi:hypothetical protein
MGFIKTPRDKKAIAKPTALVTTTTPVPTARPAPTAGTDMLAWWVSDVTFLVEGRQVQAHKGTCAAVCAFFVCFFARY